MRWNVVIFNPGRNTNQKSLLRLINTSGHDTEVVVSGLDDQGNEASGEVTISLPADEARLYSALDLEDGHSDFEGSLGTGTGKWQLFVSANRPIQVMSLMSTPTGHLTNLSTGGPRRVDDLLEADPSIAQYLTGPVEQGKSPGLLAAIVDENGVQAVAVAGVRKQGYPQALTVNDMLKIHSNTKAMTSTMLATMVADETFSPRLADHDCRCLSRAIRRHSPRLSLGQSPSARHDDGWNRAQPSQRLLGSLAAPRR